MSLPEPERSLNLFPHNKGSFDLPSFLRQFDKAFFNTFSGTMEQAEYVREYLLYRATIPQYPLHIELAIAGLEWNVRMWGKVRDEVDGWSQSDIDELAPEILSTKLYIPPHRSIPPHVTVDGIHLDRFDSVVLPKLDRSGNTQGRMLVINSAETLPHWKRQNPYNRWFDTHEETLYVVGMCPIR